MPHYTHKSAARLQMHPGLGATSIRVRATDRDSFIRIPWPRYSLARKSCTSEHENFPPLRIDGNSSLAFNHRSFCAAIPVHFARWCSIPAMDTLPTPSPASFSGQSPTRPTTIPISTSSCARSMNRVWGNWWTSGRHPANTRTRKKPAGRHAKVIRTEIGFYTRPNCLSSLSDDTTRCPCRRNYDTKGKIVIWWRCIFHSFICRRKKVEERSMLVIWVAMRENEMINFNGRRFGGIEISRNSIDTKLEIYIYIGC